ncbi:hypothetical protein IAD21_03900 [Abditibacteriota bacterium]|nr:hypothetical protein IAD21_03900 [Abditibacteriota bacterium]
MKVLLAGTLLCSSALTCFASPSTSRVHFQRGTHSTILRGYSTPSHPDHIYIVRASRGQTLKMSISSSTKGFVPMLFIASPSGRNLIEDKRYEFTSRLKESGDYRIRVAVNLMATDARSGNYRLPLSIR